MRLRRLRRLVDWAAGAVEDLAREDDTPRARVYLPWNGRDPLPGQYGAIVIYDPNDPPPEIRDDGPSPGST